MLVGVLKRCGSCRQEKPHDVFWNNRTKKDGKEPYCKECSGARTRDWYRRNKEYYREYNKTRGRSSWLKYKFGITLEEYNALLQKQKGVCAVCRDNRGTMRLHIDHDHQTGAIRGLLCGPCNRALGHADDRIDLLKAMIQYLGGE